MSRLLVDTNVVVWWLLKSPRLSAATTEHIQTSAVVFISAVVGWEIEIKRKLGKLRVPDDLEAQVAANGFVELPPTLRHTITAGRLPLHHRDPFDRLLIAQAQCEHLVLLSSDERFKVYDVDLLLA